jgi:hypothetical protein
VGVLEEGGDLGCVGVCEDGRDQFGNRGKEGDGGMGRRTEMTFLSFRDTFSAPVDLDEFLKV